MGCTTDTTLQNSELLYKNSGVITNDQQRTLDRHFPGAMGGNLLGQHVIGKLDKLGFSDKNTLFTHATCPDEINHTLDNENVNALFQ